MDNVYNLVHKSFLSILRAFCMWITFYCLLSVLYRFFVLFNFFVQVVQTTFGFLIFAIFNIATNSEIPQTTAAKQHAPFHPKLIFSNKESACGLSARERCLKGKLLLRELRILPEGFALQEELSRVNVTRSFLQTQKNSRIRLIQEFGISKQCVIRRFF